jgi:hypothetical protein
VIEEVIGGPDGAVLLEVRRSRDEADFELL